MQSSVSAHGVRSLLGATSLVSPVYRDLAGRVRLLVVDGRLGVGVRMPSERDLAQVLGLSRSTVAAAYASLRDAGVLRARRGSGNFVAPPATRQLTQLAHGPDEVGDAISFAYASGPGPAGIAAAYRRATERLPRLLTGHGYFADGILELRSSLADWFTARGLRTSADQLVITAGALSALNIVTQTLLSPGERALVESPSYPNAIGVVRKVARPVAYPLPANGWNPQDFELVLRQSLPRMSYLIPEFHNPTGAWMSEEVRPEIAASLRRFGSAAVIDETLVELSLDGAPMRTPLGAYLPDAITIGSASKAFWGGLRIGWIRAPRDLVRPLIETRTLLDLGAAPFEQLVLAELLSDSTEILAGQRVRIGAQRDILRAALSAALPDWGVNAPTGGLCVWVTLPDECSSRLAAVADRHGVVLTAGPRFFPTGGGERSLRLPYTADPDTLVEGVSRLTALWADVESSNSSQRRTVPLTLTA